MTKLQPEWFYAVMTLHGLGMVGIWYVGSMAGVSYLLSQYVKPSLPISKIAFGATLLGIVLLLASTLIGRLGVGWYFLYPLPLHLKGVWPPWATGEFLGSLAVLGVGWTIWSFDVLRAIAQRYSFSAAMAWHYLQGKSDPEVPPLPGILVHSQQTPDLRLSDFWRDKPVLVTMVFARCAGICSPFLSSLKSAADSVGGLGRDYRVVVLSFDPQDTPADMAVLAKHLGIQNDGGWVFATVIRQRSGGLPMRWASGSDGTRIGINSIIRRCWLELETARSCDCLLEEQSRRCGSGK